MGPDSYSDILPSFSVSNVDSQDDERFTLDSEMAQQFIQANPDLAQFASLLANNHTYLELLDQLISQVDQEIESNRRMQGKIRAKLSRPFENVSQSRAYSNISVPCWPPYFKDSDGMAPNMNSEALEISRICSADPLVEEEKRWVPSELELLRDSVCSSLKDGEISLLDSRKEIFQKKLRAAGVETTNEQRHNWIDEVERINRRITYIRSRSVNDFLKEHSNYDSVDWSKLSARDFKGVRTISQLRQKWCNEMCPLYNKSGWTLSEDEKLIDLSRDFSNWDVISEMLDSARPPFLCFQRLNYLRQNEHEPKPWTPVEDQKLRKLILMHRVGEEIPWQRSWFAFLFSLILFIFKIFVALYMPGRSKLNCEYRYTRSLSEKVRHGRWTEAEDILLLEAINKYGPRNWVKISNHVRGRSALQCRDRWIHVLDHKRRDRPWTWEEHMRLFYGVRLFGRDDCAKIARLLPGRNNMDVRMRTRFLVKLQIEAKMKEKPVIFRHFANNYSFFKTRRKNILDEFSKYLETKQNDKKASMAARLGLGSFVATSNVGVHLDYTNVTKLRVKEFDDWSVMNSGRWMKHQYKNPNEQDHDDLLHELEQFPDKIREETLLWLKESDVRFEAELEQEKELPEDPKQSVDFYNKMFTAERVDQLYSSINELLPPRECDILYYIKHQRRPRKIGVLKQQKYPKKKKKERLDIEKIVANIDKLDNTRIIGLRWSDKLLIDLNKEMVKLPMEERRHYLMAKLCGAIRHRMHHSTVKKFKTDENFIGEAFQQMLEYVRDRVNKVHNQVIIASKEPPLIKLPAPTPTQPPLILPSNWRNLTMKELIQMKVPPKLLNSLAEAARSEQTQEISVPVHEKEKDSIVKDAAIISIQNRVMKMYLTNLLPPCIATVNCMDLYNKTIRQQLKKDLNSYRDFEPDAPGTSTQTSRVFDIDKAYGWSDIKDKVRVTPEYALLKMRMFRLFFYPLAMVKAINPQQNNL
uniref:snRNA-activating protein complex subunit 4 n=1 Tax=Meloidogyne incognita TaxID=6306 RepID=A0A914NI90_MELIC